MTQRPRGHQTENPPAEPPADENPPENPDNETPSDNPDRVPDVFLFIIQHNDGQQTSELLTEEQAEARYTTLTDKGTPGETGGAFEIPDDNITVLKLAATRHTFKKK